MKQKHRPRNDNRSERMDKKNKTDYIQRQKHQIKFYLRKDKEFEDLKMKVRCGLVQ